MAEYGQAFNPQTSCETCKVQGQDVNHGSCPLWMADGRSFGDVVYKPRCQQQYQQYQNEFATNFDYRLFLIQNAESLMKQNMEKASTRIGDW